MLKPITVAGMVIALVLLLFAPKILAALVVVVLTVVSVVCFVLIGLFPLLLELIEKFVPKKEEKGQHDH